MEEQDKAGVDQPYPDGNVRAESTGDESAEESSAARRRQLDELTQAYERARDELNDAVRSLRAEVARIDLEQARTRARSWVDENPVLAVFIGVGAGIVAGRLLSTAFHSEPKTLSDRARYRADELRGRAGGLADELGAALAYQLSRAARSAGDAGGYVAHRGADVAETVSKRAREVGEDVSERARHAGKEFSRRAENVGRDVSRRTIHWSEDASRRAEEIAEGLADSTAHSVRVLEEATDELSKTLKKSSKKARKKAKKRADRGLQFSDTVANAARTAVAAVVVKKVSDWMRAFR